MVDEKNKTLKALKTAIQMEIDGKEFYLEASQSSKNELGKKLLKQLAAEEDAHRKVFEDIYNDISIKKGWPTGKLKTDGGKGLRTIFSAAVAAMDKDFKAIPTELDAVQTAMKMENKTFDFYKRQGAQAAYDAEKQFYEALAVQEEEHYRVLLDYYEFLKNPEAWFVQKEHPSLDGG
jgi:rubrerythrin